MIKRSRCAQGNFKNESTLKAVGQWALNALPGPPRLSCKRPQAPRNAVVVPSPANCSVPGCGSTANNLFAGGTTIYFVCLLFLSSEASVTPSFPIHSLTDAYTHTPSATLAPVSTATKTQTYLRALLLWPAKDLVHFSWGKKCAGLKSPDQPAPTEIAGM